MNGEKQKQIHHKFPKSSNTIAPPSGFRDGRRQLAREDPAPHWTSETFREESSLRLITQRMSPALFALAFSSKSHLGSNPLMSL